MPNFHRFSYSVPPKDPTRNLLVHRLRDGDACLELVPLLYGRGYTYAENGLLLNFPPENISQEEIQIDESFLRPADLLVLTNRPPLNDEEESGFKQVHRSHTSLEKKVFDILEQYFAYCSRYRIQLSEDISAMLPEHFADRATIEFAIQNTAWCKARQRYNGGRHWVKLDNPNNPARYNLTMAYLLYRQTTWPGGPGLLVAFGMDGPQTLAWAHILRTRYPNLLDSSVFAMAEITKTDIPSPRELRNLDFAGTWEVNNLLLIHHNEDTEEPSKAQLVVAAENNSE